ncbi:hypothetical protein O181_044424 [Austropuccinia psidii MF-1]|uniref:Uncharacterized protein n=1 Tax=Austropuccinia psidii MF-1 TaxID=1389203 RepID=A0A9Q3DK02_9BASI|nr:hypothetical protein [Austropuccinia psidii MF-1]
MTSLARRPSYPPPGPRVADILGQRAFHRSLITGALDREGWTSSDSLSSGFVPQAGLTITLISTTSDPYLAVISSAFVPSSLPQDSFQLASMAKPKLRKRKRSPDVIDSYESDDSSDIEIIEYNIPKPSRRKPQANQNVSSDSESASDAQADTESDSDPEQTFNSSRRIWTNLSRPPLSSKVPTSNKSKTSSQTSRPKTISTPSKPPKKKFNLRITPQASKSKQLTTPTLSAFELKKQEIETSLALKRKQETIIDILKTKVMSELVDLGNFSRDVTHICSETFEWDFQEWEECLKGAKVVIYESLTNSGPASKQRRNKSRFLSGTKTWPLSLQVTGLSLCIMKSGGIIVELQDYCPLDRLNQIGKGSSWDVMKDFSQLSCIFIHRSSISTFLSESRPSVVDLTRHMPRIQIYLFGNSEPLRALDKITHHSPRVELGLRAGAIIIPTFASLFQTPSTIDKDQRQYFLRLQAACRIHPFLRVCLHPSLHSRLISILTADASESHSSIDYLIDFLTKVKIYDPKQTQFNRITDWIKPSRTQISWLPNDIVETSESIEDEITETLVIVDFLKDIRQELFLDFRRFIVVLPDDHPQLGRSSIDQVECMGISQLCQILATDPF